LPFSELFRLFIVSTSGRQAQSRFLSVANGEKSRVARRVLVVTTANDPEKAVDSLVREHAGVDAEVRVIAPASKISWLDWLTNDEDAARVDAAKRAEAASDAAPTERVDANVGDVDPLQAIEDALRTFPADEVLVLTPPEQQAEWLEKGLGSLAQRRFSVPVTQIVTR
jgi:hypothetical protein